MMALLQHVVDRLNNLFVRFTLDGSDDTGKIQNIWGRGRDRESYGTDRNPIMRHQPAGLSARPTKGVGVIINLLGNNDQSIALALENQDARPTGLEPGETVLYNEFGITLKLDKDGLATLTASKIKLVATGDVVVKPGGTVYLGGDPADGGTFQRVAHALSQDSNGDVINGATCSANVLVKE